MALGRKTGGRQKGTPNHLTKSVKEAFEAVFTDLQRDAQDPVNLANWARANLTEFYKLAARLIPTNIAGELHTDTRLIING